jgi:hypothetical protein
MKKFLSILAILLLPSSAFAGAWTSEPLHSWHKVAYNYFYSDEVWDENGDVIKEPSEFTDWNISYYGQLGLTGWLDFSTSFAYKNLTTEDAEFERNSSGIGDVDLGLKGRFLEKPLVMSGQFTFTMPWAYDTDDFVPLGDGMPDYEVKLLLGRSLHPLPAYVGAEAGYKIREGYQPNTVTYLAEVGVSLWKFYLREKLYGWEATEGIEDDPEVSRSVSPDSALMKLDSTLGVQIVKWVGVEAGYTYQVRGRNTAKGDTISAGITGSF